MLGLNRHKYFLVRVVVISSIFCGLYFKIAQAQGEESITITTYYPSPYGSYRQLIVTDSMIVGTGSPANPVLKVGGFIRASRFEDLDNPAYYVDPQGATFLNALSINSIASPVAASSALHIQGGYLQIQSTASPPPIVDCGDAAIGRMILDTTNNRLYICNGTPTGWEYLETATGVTGVTDTLNFPGPSCEQTTTTELVVTNGSITDYTETTGGPCPQD